MREEGRQDSISQLFGGRRSMRGMRATRRMLAQGHDRLQCLASHNLASVQQPACPNAQMQAGMLYLEQLSGILASKLEMILFSRLHAWLLDEVTSAPGTTQQHEWFWHVMLGCLLVHKQAAYCFRRRFGPSPHDGYGLWVGFMQGEHLLARAGTSAWIT